MRQFLRALRGRLEMSQQKLGELIDKTQAAVSRLEGDHSASGFDVVSAIAAANQRHDKSPMIWTRWLAGSEGEQIWRTFEHVLYVTAETFDCFEKSLDDESPEQTDANAHSRDNDGPTEPLRRSWDVWFVGHNPPECHSKAEFDKTVRRLIRGNTYIYWIPASQTERMRTYILDLQHARRTNTSLQEIDFDAAIRVITTPPTMGLLPLWFVDPLAEKGAGDTLGLTSFDIGKRSTRYFVLPEVTADSLVQDHLKPIFHKLLQEPSGWTDKSGFSWSLASAGHILENE